MLFLVRTSLGPEQGKGEEVGPIFDSFHEQFVESLLKTYLSVLLDLSSVAYINNAISNYFISVF